VIVLLVVVRLVLQRPAPRYPLNTTPGYLKYHFRQVTALFFAATMKTNSANVM
jgi:hypothetical protein